MIIVIMITILDARQGRGDDEGGRAQGGNLGLGRQPVGARRKGRARCHVPVNLS